MVVGTRRSEQGIKKSHKASKDLTQCVSGALQCINTNQQMSRSDWAQTIVSILDTKVDIARIIRILTDEFLEAHNITVLSDENVSSEETVKAMDFNQEGEVEEAEEGAEVEEPVVEAETQPEDKEEEESEEEEEESEEEEEESEESQGESKEAEAETQPVVEAETQPVVEAAETQQPVVEPVEHGAGEMQVDEQETIELNDAATQNDDAASEIRDLIDVLRETTGEIREPITTWFKQVLKKDVSTVDDSIWNLLENQHLRRLKMMKYQQKIEILRADMKTEAQTIMKCYQNTLSIVPTEMINVKTPDVSVAAYCTQLKHAVVNSNSVHDITSLLAVTKFIQDHPEGGEIDLEEYRVWKKSQESSHSALIAKHQSGLREIELLTNGCVQKYFVPSKMRVSASSGKKRPRNNTTGEYKYVVPDILPGEYKVAVLEGDSCIQKPADFTRMVGTIKICLGARPSDEKEKLGIRGAHFDGNKWSVTSLVLLFDKEISLCKHETFTTRSEISGGALFGKSKVGTGYVARVQQFAETCGCDAQCREMIVFGYHPDSDDVGSCFILLPASAYVQPLVDAMKEINFYPLKCLSSTQVRLKKDLAQPLFGSKSVVRIPTEDQPYLWSADIRKKRKSDSSEE